VPPPPSLVVTVLVVEPALPAAAEVELPDAHAEKNNVASPSAPA
jgi:hypothetical protein